MANEETYWIRGKGAREVQLTYNDMQWLLGRIVAERGGVDPKLLEERVEWLKGVLKKSLWYTSEMVRVQAGTFRVELTRNDPEGRDDEKPVHEVQLTYDYWMGRFPVVFGEYDQYSRENGLVLAYDQGFGRGNRPVINVSWRRAIRYCNWLSEKAGLVVKQIGDKKVIQRVAVAYDSNGHLLDSNGNKTSDITKVEGYRLPTEAEWVYAARGGHKSVRDYKYAGSDDLDEVGWYNKNSDDQTHPVGMKKPNELGLYDMSGNVDEWCHNWYGWDWYEKGSQTNPTGPSGPSKTGAHQVLRGGSLDADASSSRRVRRGGGWYDDASSCRVANRGSSSPSNSRIDLGFRLARTVIK